MSQQPDLADVIYFQVGVRERAHLQRLLKKIATSYPDDPGTSDLDDEQPVGLTIDLGDVRLARSIVGRIKHVLHPEH